jgi:group I intron endonuclease
MAIVYCTTNIVSGKKYIGSHNGKKPNYLGSGVNFTQAIKKYGKENFVRQTLWEGPNEFRYEMEEYWIDYFDAYKNQMFYNMTEKGVGRITGFKMKQESIDKRLEKMDFSFLSDPKVISKRINNINWKKQSLKRTLNTDYSKIDYSKHTCKQMNTPEIISKRNEKILKPILQYDLKGNLIKEWKSATEVMKKLNFNKGAINNCLKNRTKSSYSFIWKYKK